MSSKAYVFVHVLKHLWVITISCHKLTKWTLICKHMDTHFFQIKQTFTFIKHTGSFNTRTVNPFMLQILTILHFIFNNILVFNLTFITFKYKFFNQRTLKLWYLMFFNDKILAFFTFDTFHLTSFLFKAGFTYWVRAGFTLQSRKYYNIVTLLTNWFFNNILFDLFIFINNIHWINLHLVIR